MFAAISKLHQIFSVVDALRLLNQILAHDPRTVDAKELLRIKLLFHRFQGLMQQVATAFAVEFHVIFRGWDPIYVFRTYHLNSCAHFHRETGDMAPRLAFQQPQESFCRMKLSLRAKDLSRTSD